MNNFVHFWNYRRSWCYRSFVKAVHFFLWCYGVNFVYIISHICTPKTKEELSNITKTVKKSIPKPYYKRKQRPRNITSLKGSIRPAVIVMTLQYNRWVIFWLSVLCGIFLVACWIWIQWRLNRSIGSVIWTWNSNL